MMRQIMAPFDEYQSKENAKHVLRAMNENARHGFWNGALPPRGYRIVAAEQRGAKTKKKRVERVKAFARVAGERIRPAGGGYRREHLRALAQRIEVADKEVRIMGSKSELLRTLVAASGGKSAAIGVQPSVLKWRTR